MKTNSIKVRCSPEWEEKVREAAGSMGMSRFIREVVDDYIEGLLSKPSYTPIEKREPVTAQVDNDPVSLAKRAVKAKQEKQEWTMPKGLAEANKVKEGKKKK